jgi:hypothetical protein
MRLFIECLPLLSGPVVLILFCLTKASFFSTSCLVLIPAFFGLAANFLSGEGIAYLAVDLLKACGSMSCFFLIRSFDRKLRFLRL